MKIHKCDLCGKFFNAFDEQEHFGLHYHNVGYGSKYDGYHIDIDMCCDCFDKTMTEYIEPKLKFKDSAIKDYVQNRWRNFLMKIKIKYFTDIEPLEYIGGEGKSNWIDLRAAEDVDMKAGDFKLIPLGVGMILPEGYEAHIVPRSSTFKSFGIIQTNSCGIVDSSYSGDNDMWRFPAYALRDTHISKNDRICQFRIEKTQPTVEFETVEHLNDIDRGGFGSSGKN